MNKVDTTKTITATAYLDLCNQNIEIACKNREELINKIFNSFSIYATIFGVSATLGFSALDHVVHPIFFFTAEIFLFSLIIFCLVSIKDLSAGAFKELSKQLSFYLNKRKEINKALFENNISKQQELVKELIDTTLKKATEEDHEGLFSEANIFDRKICILILLATIAFTCLILSFVPISYR